MTQLGHPENAAAINSVRPRKYQVLAIFFIV